MTNFYNIFKIFLFLVFCIESFNATAQTNQVLEAETAILKGTAVIVACNSASGGKMVKGLDNGDANAVLFQNIVVQKSGAYFIEVSYFAVSERNLVYKLNNGEEKTETIPASGAWCYQGGLPADFIFEVTFSEGNNNLIFYNSPIIDKIAVLKDTTARKASAFFISSSLGNDSNDGLTPETAFQTFARINSLDLLPGDSLFFKSGDTFTGELAIINEGGSVGKPVLVSNYGEGSLPVFDGEGFLSTIHVVNSGWIEISNIEIKNDGGPAKPEVSEDLRYGIYIENTFFDGTVFGHYRFENLTFRNIYPTTQITDDDQTGVNAHAIITSGSWGDEIHPSRFDDMLIENCFFTRTARHAVVLKAVNNLVIRNNLFEHVGGAGMVINNNCTNILVERNTTNYTGSSIDSRMAGRGSGIWCYRTKNLTVQHNSFMHARGIHDSYGMHIDIGNRNVVYQYNYSEDNEGGFVEILGANINVGYRYNLSVGDGWRKRGNRFGQIFWLAGWSGDPKNPIGSDSIYIYNNSVYVRDTIAPGIWIEEVSKNARIYNNIIHVANEFGPVVIKNNSNNNDFDYNIWYGNIPETDEDGHSYRGPNAITSNPMFSDEILNDSFGVILQSGSPAFGAGKLIYNSNYKGPFDGFYSHGGSDYFGNEVSILEAPNIGAFNGDLETGFFNRRLYESKMFIFPNPVRSGAPVDIQFFDWNFNQSLTVQIFDITGKLRLERIFCSDEKVKLQTKELSRGMYFVNIKFEDFSETKQLFVF